jgi:hypothetical protein
MSDHLGVNDIPKAKSLENNDRSTALTVNAAGTSPHICAKSVPSGLPPEVRALVDKSRAWIRGKLAEHPGRADVFHRHRTADSVLDRIAGGDTSPEVFRALSERLASLRRVTREGGQ